MLNGFGEVFMIPGKIETESLPKKFEQLLLKNSAATVATVATAVVVATTHEQQRHRGCSNVERETTRKKVLTRICAKL